MLAEICPEGALIDVGGVEYLQRLLTQDLELTGAGRGTGLAQVARPELPAGPCRLPAAAVDAGQLKGHGTPALAAPGKGGVTGALPPVQTAPTVLGGNEARVADAMVAGVRVDAPPVVAGVAAGGALVLVHALVVLVHDGALGTLARKRAQRVGAVSANTETSTTRKYDIIGLENTIKN